MHIDYKSFAKVFGFILLVIVVIVVGRVLTNVNIESKSNKASDGKMNVICLNGVKYYQYAITFESFYVGQGYGGLAPVYDPDTKEVVTCKMKPSTPE